MEEVNKNKKRNKQKFIFVIAFLFFCFSVFLPVRAMEPLPAVLTEAFIQTEQLDWQSYQFSVRTNLEGPGALSYYWVVDGKQSFYTPAIQLVLEKGEHLIVAQVTDPYGNVASDTVKVRAAFWALTNPWMWWSLYLIVVALILYYWVSKISYLTLRNRVEKDAQNVLDMIFDEHSLVSQVIELEIKNIAGVKTRKSAEKGKKK